MNKDKILRLIGFFDEALQGLRALQAVPKEEVLATTDRYALEHLFYRLAMSAIDICFHISASLGGRVPETYKRCFDILFEQGLIDWETRERLSRLAGLRNLIAHLYWQLDYELLYGFLEELDELEPFRRAVLDLLNEVEGDIR